jgi:hypothetical protein
MHTIRSAMPDLRLKPFVRCFAQREISVQTSSFVETALASLEPIVSFCLSGQTTTHHWSGTSAIDPHIPFLGTQTRSPGCFSFTGSVLAFGIFLKPFASWQLFRIPPAQFADQKFEAREVFGPWIIELWLKLAECETFCDRIRLATETLLPFAEQATPPTRTMAAAEKLLQADSGMRIERLARESCMTFEPSNESLSERWASHPSCSPDCDAFKWLSIASARQEPGGSMSRTTWGISIKCTW